MVDLSKVSGWVQKAVADIAAFDGNTRKIDSQSEKNVLSSMLAGNLSSEDKEYIEGFMLARGASKTPKVNGKNPEKNTERAVKTEFVGTLSAKNQTQMEKLKSMNKNMETFFDENGEVIRSVITGENGEQTSIIDYKKLDDGTVIGEQETKNPWGGTEKCKFKYNPDTKESKLLEHISLDSNGNVTYEQHTDAQGNITEKGLAGPNGETFEQTVVDGKVKRIERDAEENIIRELEGTADKNGNVQFPIDK